MATFAEIGVRTRTLEVLDREGITEPLPVQRDALPHLLASRDCVIEAPTGSGKTLAFAIPMVERLRGHRPGGPRALVVVPTRELAMQVAAVIASSDPGIRVATLYGGVGYGAQLEALKGGADAVVGCPGRILDLCGSGRVSMSRVDYLVLDEADEMLDAGFARDVEKIIEMCSRPQRQTVLASATMPEWVQRMIDKHLREPARVRIVAETVPALEHGILAVEDAVRVETLTTLLRAQPQGSGTIVFTRTKHGAKKLSRKLGAVGVPAVELQGNLSQNARERSITAFREGEVSVLVATNVAARGLDVSHVGLVVNFELPETAQWLTHRIGRTARNGAEGKAVTFLAPSDHEQWLKLQRGGAPRLLHLDGPALVGRGQWAFLPAEQQPVVRAPRPVPAEGSGSPRSWRSRRPRGRRPQARVPAAG